MPEYPSDVKRTGTNATSANLGSMAQALLSGDRRRRADEAGTALAYILASDPPPPDKVDMSLDEGMVQDRGKSPPFPQPRQIRTIDGGAGGTLQTGAPQRGYYYRGYLNLPS